MTFKRLRKLAIKRIISSIEIELHETYGGFNEETEHSLIELNYWRHKLGLRSVNASRYIASLEQSLKEFNAFS